MLYNGVAAWLRWCPHLALSKKQCSAIARPSRHAIATIIIYFGAGHCMRQEDMLVQAEAEEQATETKESNDDLRRDGAALCVARQ